MRLESDVVRDHARGQWIGLLGRLAPSLEAALARPGHHVPCPVHGGRDGFRVFRDVNETGGGVCNTCGAFSDGFALLMWANGWSFRAALEAVARDLRLDLGGSWTVLKSRTKSRPTHAPAGDPASAKQALHRVWEQTIEPDAQEAEPLRRYLLRRGIEALPDPAWCGFIPPWGTSRTGCERGHFRRWSLGSPMPRAGSCHCTGPTSPRRGARLQWNSRRRP